MFLPLNIFAQKFKLKLKFRFMKKHDFIRTKKMLKLQIKLQRKYNLKMFDYF